jgi:hypothetical protein
VLEIPPTIVFYNPIGRYVPGVRYLYGRIRKVRRLFDRKHEGVQWLRPYPYMTVERMQRVVALARKGGARVLNMTFHSSELMPGGSPYNKTEAAIEDLYVRLEGFLRALAADGVRAVTLDQARELILAGSDAPARH